jgi:hypothetical protein
MSQKLDLDYVEHQAFSVTTISPWTLALCLFGLLMTLVVINQVAMLENEAKAVESILQAKSRTQQKKHTQSAPVAVYSEAELKLIRQTASELGTPWDPLLTGLENINMKEVALLLFEPNKKKQQILLTGQAKNIAIMLSYVEEVSKLPMLSKVYLQNHMIDLNDPYKPVSFTIVATWQ